jgi:hypothetical protein
VKSVAKDSREVHAMVRFASQEDLDEGVPIIRTLKSKDGRLFNVQLVTEGPSRKKKRGDSEKEGGE